MATIKTRLAALQNDRSIAEHEGKTLEEKLRELYGKDADLETLPVWGEILRWDRETA